METPDTEKLKLLFKLGSYAALFVVLMIPIQLFFYIAWPPPSNVVGFFDLFRSHSFLGLISMDLLYIVSNTVLIFIYLALFFALRRDNYGASLSALILGSLGIAAYYASTSAFEMMSLSKLYGQAVDGATQKILLGAGEVLLAQYKGTAFNIYYVLNAATLLLFSWVMIKGSVFGKRTAILGLISGGLMLLPSTAGTLGLIFSLASLLPWILFSIMISRRFYKLSQ